MCLVQTHSAKVAGKGSLQRKAFSSHASCVTAESKRAWVREKEKSEEDDGGRVLLSSELWRVRHQVPSRIRLPRESRWLHPKPEVADGCMPQKLGQRSEEDINCIKERWGWGMETLQTNKTAPNTDNQKTKLNRFTNNHINISGSIYEITELPNLSWIWVQV